jgi:hypothetical protein
MTPSASSSEPTREVDRDADAERTVGAEPAVPTGRPADPEVPRLTPSTKHARCCQVSVSSEQHAHPRCPKQDALVQAREEPVDDEGLNG